MMARSFRQAARDGVEGGSRMTWHLPNHGDSMSDRDSLTTKGTSRYSRVDAETSIDDLAGLAENCRR